MITFAPAFLLLFVSGARAASSLRRGRALALAADPAETVPDSVYFEGGVALGFPKVAELCLSCVGGCLVTNMSTREFREHCDLGYSSADSCAKRERYGWSTIYCPATDAPSKAPTTKATGGAPTDDDDDVDEDDVTSSQPPSTRLPSSVSPTLKPTATPTPAQDWCPNGYYDHTNGNAKHWGCGCNLRRTAPYGARGNCAGGCYTNGGCGCACVPKRVPTTSGGDGVPAVVLAAV